MPAATPLPDLTIQAANAQPDMGAAVAFSTSAAPAAALKARWDFGDGTTSTETAPQHRFERAGDLTVKLTLTNEAGAEKTYTLPVGVSNKALVQGNYCSAADDQGWCWMPPQTSGNAVLDLRFADARTGWRVGEMGEIFKTLDAGKTWTRQPSGVSNALDQILVRSADDVVAVSSTSNLALISSDGGKNWQKQTLTGTGTLYPIGGGKLVFIPFSATAQNPAAYLDRADGNWQTLSLGSYDQLDVGADGSLLTLSGRQLSRRATPMAAPQVVLTAPASPASALADKLTIYRTSNQTVWLRRLLRDAHDPGVAGKISLYRSVDGGQQWSPVIEPTSFKRKDGTPVDMVFDDVYPPALLSSDAGGVKIAMFSYRNGGDSPGRWGETLWASDDGGISWTERLTGGINWYTSIGCWPVGARVFCALGDANLISQAYGASFQGIDTGVFGYATLALNFARPAGAALSLTWHGATYLESPDGSPWTPTYSAIASASFTGRPDMAGAVPSFGSRKMARRILKESLYATSDSGHSWSELGQLLTAGTQDSVGLASAKTANQTVTALAAVEMPDERTLFLRTTTGKVLVSRDGGATWQRPTELNADGQVVNDLRMQSAQLGWASKTVSGAPSLLITRDGGISWQAASFLPTSGIRSIQLGTGHELTLIGSDGGVYRSTDDGSTWTNPGNASAAITNSFLSPDGMTLWATGAAGAVFKSNDKGASWTKQQLTTSANLLAVCFADASNGWVSGQAGQMWATRDGGATWRQQTVPAKQDLTSLNCQDSRTVWVGGPEGLLATGTGG